MRRFPHGRGCIMASFLRSKCDILYGDVEKMEQSENEKVIKRSRKTVGGFLDAEYILSECETVPEAGYKNAYSVRASVTDLRTGMTDSGAILDVTRDRRLAERIFSLVVNGGVTPVSLSGVISDILSDPGEM